MSGGGGSVRVPIPSHSRQVIQDIREITGKQHSDDDIYAVLKECSMDPNETAQKLLHLDTFHEVRRRRDRKKESSWASVDSKPKQGGQGRGGRGASGGYSSNFTDGSGGRNANNRKEIGVNHVAERNHAPTTKSAAQKTKSNGASHITRVSAVASSPANQSNGSASHGLAGQLLTGSLNGSPAPDSSSKRENTQPYAAVAAVSSRSQAFESVTRTEHGKSIPSSDQLPISASSVSSVHPSSDSVLEPSILLNSAINSANDGEVGGQQLTDGLNHVDGNKAVPHEVGELPASESKRSGSLNLTNNKKSQNKSNEAEENQLSEAAQSSPHSYSTRPSSCGSQAPPEVSTSEVCMQSSDESKQHVIVTFPNHFQVPEALKSGLIFGSFDSDFDKTEMFSRTGGDNNTSSALHSSQGSDKTATSSNQSASSTEPGDHSDYTHSPSDLNEKPSVSEVNAVSGTEPMADQSKQEVQLAPVGKPIPTTMDGQSFGLNFMSPMLRTQQVQFKGAEPQAQETTGLPNYVSANSHSVSSPSPSPSPSPTPPLQSSLPTAPQPISFFRPPYPPNFIPYPYYPPIYVSPIHQYVNHNGFPQQPSTGNIYVPAAAPGIKFPLQQLKAGANTGNTTHIGISPGSFISPPVGYAPNQTVNSGNLPGNEDLTMSQLKENHVFTTGQLSEGSAMWIPAPGQEISNLQLNSMYNFNHQGHLMFPPTQAGHPFAGIYQPGQTVPSPSTLLQPSQSVTGSVETAGAPSVAYQQPQHVQMNWNSNF